MTPDEYKWHIELVKDRHHALNLTFEQAEKIYKYELDKDTYSGKHYLSAWEEWDFELTTFRDILDGEQFKEYETFLIENIRRYEESLFDQDDGKSNEIAYHEALMNFYQTQFLPDFFKDPILRFGLLLSEKTKVEYLRKEYKRFLDDTKMEILSMHFRHNRTFKPNELKVSLLRHKLSYFLPDYSYFKDQMDEPTKAVAHFLRTKFRYLPETIEELLTEKFKELKEFNDTNIKKYYSDTKGWHIVIGPLAKEEEKEHRVMTLLLLDEEKYGC